MTRPVAVAPDVYWVQLGTLQAYLWARPDGLTVIDAGLPGSAPAIVESIEAIGRQAAEVQEIVLTHFHTDHRGGAAELVRRTGAQVVAGASDAAVIRGQQAEPPPHVTESERPLLEMIRAHLPQTPPEPVEVDREVDEGDVVLGGGRIISVPGHTPGSIALLIPASGVLFTGDTIACTDGRPVLGPFNIDRDLSTASVRKLAGLAFDAACFGHGPPIVGGADTAIRALADSLGY